MKHLVDLDKAAPLTMCGEKLTPNHQLAASPMDLAACYYCRLGWDRRFEAMKGPRCTSQSR